MVAGEVPRHPSAGRPAAGPARRGRASSACAPARAPARPGPRAPPRGGTVMTIGERVDAFLRLFQFRTPQGQFRSAPAKAPDPARGEVAFADPRRLFPGIQPFSTYNPSVLV